MRNCARSKKVAGSIPVVLFTDLTFPAALWNVSWEVMVAAA